MSEEKKEKLKERYEIKEEIEQMREKGYDNLYLNSVYGVNNELIKRDEEMGKNMYNAVKSNLDDIRAQTGSLPTYHGKEVVALCKDSSEALGKGDYHNAALNATGAGLNTASFFVSAVIEANDRKRGVSIHDSAPSNDSSNTNDDSSNTNVEDGNTCLVM